MLTGDENIIDLQFAVQYNLKVSSRLSYLIIDLSKTLLEGLQKLQFERLWVKVKWILFYMKGVKKLQLKLSP